MGLYRGLPRGILRDYRRAYLGWGIPKDYILKDYIGHTYETT
jgi:hypothetical protein